MSWFERKYSTEHRAAISIKPIQNYFGDIHTFHSMIAMPTSITKVVHLQAPMQR